MNHDEAKIDDEVERELRDSVEVRVGDRSIIVGRFKGYKATRVMEEVKEIAKRYPTIGRDLTKYRQDYANENALRFERAEAEFQFGPDAARITDRAWESSGGELRIRRAPTMEEQLLQIYPELMDKAKKATLRLIGILAIPNSEMKSAFDEGGDDAVTEAVDKLVNELLFEGDADQIIELLLAGAEVGRAQFGPLRAAAKQAAMMLGLRSKPKAEPELAKDPEATETETTEDGASSPDPPATGPTAERSSTDLETPTDGHPTTPSGPTGSPSDAPATL